MKIEFLLDTMIFFEPHKDIPVNTRGVYMFYDVDIRKMLYIGKANCLKKRLYEWNYSGSSTIKKLERMLELHEFMHVRVFKCNEYGILEEYLIEKYDPKYNVVKVKDQLSNNDRLKLAKHPVIKKFNPEHSIRKL